MTAPTIREQLTRALSKLGDKVRTYGRDHEDAIPDYVAALVPFGPHGLAAIEAWPTHGGDWPALKDLLDLAQAAQHRARIAAAAAQGAGSSPVAKFIATVLRSERGGPGYVRSWLDPSAYPMLGETVIRTTKLGAETLGRDFGELAENLGVKFSYERTADTRLTEFVGELRAAGKLETERRRARA